MGYKQPIHTSVTDELILSLSHALCKPTDESDNKPATGFAATRCTGKGADLHASRRHVNGDIVI